MENVPNSWLKVAWREWIKPFLALVLVLGSFRSAVADWNYVPTGSMKPTILEGDRILVNKMAYDLKVPFVGWRLVHRADPERGDAIVFFSPVDGTRLVKRVVAMPGDQVMLRDNRLWINGQAATYEPLDPEILQQIDPHERSGHEFAAERIDSQSHPMMTTPAEAATRHFGPLTIPEGHYFVMGDNRDNSFDSRSFGLVRRDAIAGRAETVIISLDREDSLPRGHRFFRKLD